MEHIISIVLYVIACTLMDQIVKLKGKPIKEILLKALILLLVGIGATIQSDCFL
jgi:hypothetical protein